jgi:hypothetical protein
MNAGKIAFMPITHAIHQSVATARSVSGVATAAVGRLHCESVRSGFAGGAMASRTEAVTTRLRAMIQAGDLVSGLDHRVAVGGEAPHGDRQGLPVLGQ